MLLWKWKKTSFQGSRQTQFQSLFSWMLLWKSRPRRLRADHAEFQSLFSWMLLWKTALFGILFDWFQEEFQSLFSWMLLWKYVILAERGGDYLFQSLFSWMLLWKYLYTTPPYSFNCFNPCSLGCCSERGGPRNAPEQRCCFNPCSLGCCSERR
mgnify:CR=1 FL=1